LDRILVVDDDILEWVILCRKFPALEIHWQRNVYGAIDMIRTEARRFDLVICDICGTSMGMDDDPLGEIQELIDLHKKVWVVSQADIPVGKKMTFVPKDELVEHLREALA